MHPTYPNMFSPLRVGPVELPNRFYMSPHVCPHVTPQGAPTEDYDAYYLERIRGGCGLAILSLATHSGWSPAHPCPHPAENIPGFRRFANAIHDAGGKVFGELWCWWGAPGQWGPLSPPMPSMTPSANQFGLHERRHGTREMGKSEIRHILAALRQSARHLREAAFDGIMLHAAHGALAEQFLSPYFNRRTDEYGGAFENRLRFLMEALTAIRDGAGPGLAIGMRFNCNELMIGGYDLQEAYKAVEAVANSGLIDFVDLDVGVEPEQFYLGMPPVFVQPLVYAPYVEAVRKAAGRLPVFSVLGRLSSIADGEGAIASGLCDMVGAARALIAEPQLVKNAYEGREAQSRRCIACNWCMFALTEGAQTCTINPASWREREWGVDRFEPATRRSKVVVVGAGPAGLEAARVSALRGHEVILFEARDVLGGGLELWSRLPGREFFRDIVDWWGRELARLGVQVNLKTSATAGMIQDLQPDAVILAAGSRYSVTGRSAYREGDITGYDLSQVHSPEAVIGGEVSLSGRIVVVDAEGLHTGVGVAEMLALGGAEVELVTPHASPVSPRLWESQDATFVYKRLLSAGVKVSTHVYPDAFTAAGVDVRHIYSGEAHTIAADHVVLVTGRLPSQALEGALEGKVAQLFAIGDAAAPRVWATASYEGQKFARYIGEPDAPRTTFDAFFGPSPS